MGKERRRAPRFETNLFVDLCLASSKDSVGRGVVVDVSQTGLSVETEADLGLETDVDCHVEMPFVLKAKIVRRLSRGHIRRYGLAILNQNFLDKILLKRILKGLKSTRKV